MLETMRLRRPRLSQRGRAGRQFFVDFAIKRNEVEEDEEVPREVVETKVEKGKSTCDRSDIELGLFEVPENWGRCAICQGTELLAAALLHERRVVHLARSTLFSPSVEAEFLLPCSTLGSNWPLALREILRCGWVVEERTTFYASNSVLNSASSVLALFDALFSCASCISRDCVSIA